MFKIELGLKAIPKGAEFNTRIALRAVVIVDNKVLMIRTNKGDYKFPGGGVEGKETELETLKREIIEESGYCIKDNILELGEITERSVDLHDETKYFVMKSKYYFCELDGNRLSKCLDEYEEELGFKEQFIDIHEAIQNNQKILEQGSDINFWVERETIALKEILLLYFKQD